MNTIPVVSTILKISEWKCCKNRPKFYHELDQVRRLPACEVYWEEVLRESKDGQTTNHADFFIQYLDHKMAEYLSQEWFIRFRRRAVIGSEHPPGPVLQGVHAQWFTVHTSGRI